MLGVTDWRLGGRHDAAGYVVAFRFPQATHVFVGRTHCLPIMDDPPGHKDSERCNTYILLHIYLCLTIALDFSCDTAGKQVNKSLFFNNICNTLQSAYKHTI